MLKTTKTLLQYSFNDFQALKQNVKVWAQLDHCHAWIGGADIPGYPLSLIVLKSYDTIVAVYDGFRVYEVGKFSRTTSSQVTRFIKSAYIKDGVERVNLNLKHGLSF